MCYAAGWEAGTHEFRRRFNKAEERDRRRSVVLDEAARALLLYSTVCGSKCALRFPRTQ